MNVFVNTSARFARTPDGRLWSSFESLAYDYWTRFLDVFDRVNVLARAIPVGQPMNGSKPVSGPGVEVIPLPNWVGIPQYAGVYFSVRKLIQQSVSQGDAIYLSMPCVIGDLMWRSLPAGRPFGVAVCGDPYDAFARHTSKHPLRPVIRWWFSHRLRTACRKACACTYVTQYALQRRYPCGHGAFSTFYSNIHLPLEAIVDAPRAEVKRCAPFRLVNVTSFDSWYKGSDTLIEAFSTCVRQGVDATLTLIGDGRHRVEAQGMAEKLGVARRVEFVGQLPNSAAVRAELDTADLFVLPSRTEGLPRAMVEAMARALPCIGTAVGGIPELLATDDLVPPNDPSALARKINEVVANAARRAAMSERNLSIARTYSSDVLRSRRIAFYQALKIQSAQWKSRSVASLVKDCA